LNKRKLAAQTAYLDKWNATRGPVSGREVDVLLTPVAPHTAVPHRKSRYAFFDQTYFAYSANSP
jgi:amidase